MWACISDVAYYIVGQCVAYMHASVTQGDGWWHGFNHQPPPPPLSLSHTHTHTHTTHTLRDLSPPANYTD
jgi:hypothetical protein